MRGNSDIYIYFYCIYIRFENIHIIVACCINIIPIDYGNLPVSRRFVYASSILIIFVYHC